MNPHPVAQRLGAIGVWSGEFRSGDPSERSEAAAELEALGYGAIWIPGGAGGDVFGDVDLLLAATARAAVGTGIINIWKHEPADLGRWRRGLSPERQARLMLGLGISHGPIIGEAYGKPVATMSAYLDKLDTEGVAADGRCLAALGPKMLDLARDRTAGSHPYLVPVEHTAFARERLGPEALLAPEHGVILEKDPDKARAVAREALSLYLRLPNYTSNWRRFGFSEDEVANPSDRLVDALFAWGDLDQIGRRVRAHLDAGADHVCVQVIRGATGADRSLPRQAWRELAAALL
jgi:probable F420-dependent oxidoreductase